MNAYLASHHSKDKSECTHTRIGSQEHGVYGASYHIPDLSTFYPLYVKHVMEDGNKEYLTEKQCECGPIGIDIDFRYSEAKRQYTSENIVEFIEIILEELHTLFSIHENFPIYIFEKPNVNVTSTMIKDGIHLIVGVNLDLPGKSILRTRLLKNMDIWKSIKVTNDWDSVLDENVFKGLTGWQLYGSRKPGNEAYTLTTVYNCIKDEHDYELHCSSGKNFPLDQFYKLSIRNLENETLTLKEEFRQEYEQAKQRKKVRVVNTETHTSGEIANANALNHAIEKLHSSLEISDYIIQEAHLYVLSLPPPYYDDYAKWSRVGWALKQTDIRLFLTWVKFSSQSSKFSFSDVADLRLKWNESYKSSEVLTLRSIMYWSRTENEQEYIKIKEKSIDRSLEEAVKDSCSEYDIATILYQCYKDLFVCVDIKGARWFQYAHQKWNETDSGTELRKQITSPKGLYGIFAKKLNEVSQFMGTMTPDDERHKNVKKKYDKVHGIMVNTLKKNGDKIMKEASHIFYVKNFLNLLDSKNDILCFTNGVIDFSNNKFRDGLPEDYTHKCTNIPYIKLEDADTTIIDEVSTFMEQLFPDKELREYMWDHAASVLIGKNKNQTLNFYVGSGRNGKSIFVTLMSAILGDYKATVPISLITKPRVNIGSASPEVATLMGVRYAVMQESSVNDRINEGTMKELTGGDKILCRALYKDPLEFVPQFKLVMCTNNLPGIDGKDDGTWRRIRTVDFKSSFTESPDPSSNYQFKVDKNLDEKFEIWKPIFMSMLVERAYVTHGNVNDCKMVMVNSEKYRNDQDYLSAFASECIVIQSGSTKELAIHDRFKEWWRNNHGKNEPKGKELFDYLNKTYTHKNGVSKKGTTWHGLKVVRDDTEPDPVDT
jgi:P4 family phage/plasmid primase-like protien